MPWRVVATRKCGCEIIQLDEPRAPHHGETSERHTGSCVYHLCRLCGDVPLADAEPDVLCESCHEARGAR